MAEDDVPAAEREFRTALQSLRDAYDAAVREIWAIPDRQAAFEAATHLANHLRDLVAAASVERAETARSIQEAEGLSLAALGKKIGVSKARADQIVNPKPPKTEQSRETDRQEGTNHA